MNGEGSPSPDVVASFRLGDNSYRADGLHEFMVSEGDGSSPESAARGHLTWDPGYEGEGAFFGVAPVRLELTPGLIRWSVGTNDFITCRCRPFQDVRKIQVMAEVAGLAKGCTIQWDLLDVIVQKADGSRRTHSSPCLPRAFASAQVRRAATAERRNAIAPRQQYAEIIGLGQVWTRIQIRGQVTLSTDSASGLCGSLTADDLQGKVLVFTDAGSP